MIVRVFSTVVVARWLRMAVAALGLTTLGLASGAASAASPLDGYVATSPTGAPEAVRATVALRPAVELDGRTYTLGDVADIASTDSTLSSRLTALPIGIVPRAGVTESVARPDLAALVRQSLPGAALAWEGAAAVRIRGRGQRVDAEQLADAAAPALFTRLAGDYAGIDLQPVRGQGAVNVPSGALRLAPRLPDGQTAGKRMSVLVDVLVDGAVATTVPVWFAVQATRPALQARSALRPGDVVGSADVELRPVGLSARGGSVLAQDAPLGEMRLRRPVEAGAVLRAADVEVRPAVARDRRVAVRVVNGSVVIETTGRALADARVGETVQVQTAGSSAPFPARVVGEGMVLVSAR